MVDTSLQTLILPAENNSLIIETSEDHWAHCFLVGTERSYLGADDLSMLLTKLQRVIHDKTLSNSPSDGEIDGVPVTWILSLAEAHHVLYAAVSGEDYLLFWQDADHPAMRIAGMMRLTPQHRQQWQQQLDIFPAPPLRLGNAHRQLVSGLATEALK